MTWKKGRWLISPGEVTHILWHLCTITVSGNPFSHLVDSSLSSHLLDQLIYPT